MFILCSVEGFNYIEIQRFDNYLSALRGYYTVVKSHINDKFVIFKEM